MIKIVAQPKQISTQETEVRTSTEKPAKPTDNIRDRFGYPHY